MHRTAKYLYIIGGCALAAEREPIKNIERICIENVEKSRENSSPLVKIHAEHVGNLSIPRRSPACFLLKNQQEILISGGCTGPNNHTNTMELLRISPEFSSKILEETLEIGASCSGFDWASKGPFYPIFGGFEAHSCLDDVQVLHQSQNWNAKKLGKKLMPKIKNSTILALENREFLMFGGWEDEQKTTKAIRKIKFNEDYTDYEVEFAGFLPYPVEGHSMVRIGSNVLLIGGFDGCFVLDSIIKYDLDTKKSEILPEKLSEKRENHVSAVLSDRFLVIAGGWNSRSSLDDVEVFEIQKDSELARCQVNGKLLMARNRPAGVPI
ncbi:hypothetical protein L3Y34_016157 [Caenorhabditis briggsae]|uniref:Uncharacterized protein n=1 Tax=Caenorhabditis briggsae TaxID=6238 RepID=A0AAE9IZY2_CAEBR|nr:hypothetical protein L3Y34_016157 [Caenorhabditis briggsae]